MNSRYTITSLLILGYINFAAANQSVESINALTTNQDVASAVDQQEMAGDAVAPVVHDSGPMTTSNGPETAMPEADESGADDDALTSGSNLPAIGYVPEHARLDGQFNLVANAANEADELFQKSALSESKKLYESALKTVQRVLLVEPQHPGALLARGRLLVKTQQYPAAKASLEVLTAGRTDDWRPWFWLGTANLMLSDLTAAEHAFDEALARNSDVAESWLHQALVAQQRGNWQAALQLLSIANEISPNHPLVMLNAAMCREALGYEDEAAVGYRKFLAQSHRAEVSRLLRFEVLNHLSADRVATEIAEFQEDVETVSVQGFSENAGAVASESPPARIKHRFP